MEHNAMSQFDIGSLMVPCVERGDHVTLLRAAIGTRRWILVISRGAQARGVAVGLAAAGLQPDRIIHTEAGLAAPLAAFEGALIIAIGGGATLDYAKVLAMASAMHGDPRWPEDWFETEASPEPAGAVAQLIAVPTLPGSGAEATSSATVWLGQRKRSIEHPSLRPQRVIMDTALVETAPSDLRLISALDGLTHALEAIWNRNATSGSDVAALAALRAYTSILQARHPAGGEALEASWLAGCAIEVTRTSVCHALSYPFTAELGVPHGLAVSLTIPEVAAHVATRHPARAHLVARGLGVAPAEMRSALEVLLQRSGATRLIAKYLSKDALEQLRGSLIASARARNFLDDLDEAAARTLVATALGRVHA